MANITASMVKDLREMTGAGMMDCKKALSETDGDMDAAVEYLRKNGQAKAEKKAARIAAEGLCLIAKDVRGAAVVEVNSETDFVAKNEKFRGFVEAVASQALASSSDDVSALLTESWGPDTSKTVQEALVEQVATIGEKLDIRRFARVLAGPGQTVSTYLHGNGRIGVIVLASCSVPSDATAEALSNVCMQIAAMHPKYVDMKDIPEDFKEHERGIFKEEVANDPKMAGKPEKALAGAVEGKLSKELKEMSLNEQVYVKAEDGKQTVAQYLAQVSKEAGADVSVVSFVRFETGEGIEKRTEDFAAEVAAQMAAA